LLQTPPHRSLLTVASATSTPGWASPTTWNVFERISWPSCDPLYATDITHHKQETFLYECPLHWVLLPTRNAQQRCSSVAHVEHSHHFDHWNQSLNMRMHVCYIDCHEAGLLLSSDTHIKPVTFITGHFASIRDLFTDPLYKEWIKECFHFPLVFASESILWSTVIIIFN
jgi:hypothetical protein